MMVVTTGSDVVHGDWNETRTCVVLGGRGFSGRALVARLLRLGGWIVRVADSSSHSLQLDHSSPSDSFLSDAICSGQASFGHVDVSDISQIVKVIKGADVVFYMEPSDLDMDDFYNCYMIIVQGAKNVINACRECKVRKLIYNSDADVVFDGSHDIVGGDESLTYPGKFPDILIDLKVQAEGLIRLANNIDGLLTCVLRPSNVFGPGDTNLLPLLVNLADSGLAKFIIGSGENLSDFTYVENVAHAHICAAEALHSRVVSVAGKAFFITNLEPVSFWDFVSLIHDGLGYERPFIKVPTWIVFCIIFLRQCIYDKLCVRKHNYSVRPYYVVKLASRTRTFDCYAAEKHLGYSPVVSLEDGIRSTIESFPHLPKDPSLMRYNEFNEQSKAEKLLGSGKVADVLLWRDEKITFTCFLALVLVFYWFFLSGRTFTSSAAKLLLLVTVVLYGYGILPANIFGFSFQSMSSSCFEVSEATLKDSIRSASHMWNRGVCKIKSLARGESWSSFFKTVIVLYFTKVVLSFPLAVVAGIALVFPFTAFFVYEQYESEFDAMRKVLSYLITESKDLLMRILSAPVTLLHRNKGKELKDLE